MTTNQLVNMLRQLMRDEPNDMSFGALARQIIGKYEQQQSTSDL
jgi:hypothetical protein